MLRSTVVYVVHSGIAHQNAAFYQTELASEIDATQVFAAIDYFVAQGFIGCAPQKIYGQTIGQFIDKIYPFLFGKLLGKPK
jgi:hypothetical protein